MISIQHVSMRFGHSVAVDNVSLAIGAGEGVALWGVNGAGKTTLLRCVLGLLRFRGSIAVGGCDLRRQGKRARMLIGYVPQEIGFYDDLRVGEALAFFARLKGVRTLHPRESLGGVGLDGQLHKQIRELSGGMKQRLALAIALLGDPPLLLLDEVTTSLDAVGRDEFLGLLQQLARRGRTLLFASHRIDEVAALAGRVVRLERGRVVADVTSRQFVADSQQAALLHLTLPLAQREEAIRALQARGFSAHLNGSGVFVAVDAEHKAAPLRHLAEARIAVEDFDLVCSAASHSGASRGAGGRS